MIGARQLESRPARQIPPNLRFNHARLLWMTSRGLAAENHLGDPDRCV